MLQIKSLRADVKIDPADLRSVLAHLSDTDWKPALLESQKKVLELAGVEGRVTLPIARPFSRCGPYMPPDAFGGDVFFRGDDVFFLLTSYGESEIQTRQAYVLRDIAGTQETGTEVGIMTNDGSDIDQRLQSFAACRRVGGRQSFASRSCRFWPCRHEWLSCRGHDRGQKGCLPRRTGRRASTR